MNENSLQLIKEAIKDYPHEFVEVVPFSREILPKLEAKDYIPYGSTLMTTLGLELGWSGLSFDLSKFNYEEFLLNRTDMLNSGIITIDNLIKYLESGTP